MHFYAVGLDKCTLSEMHFIMSNFSAICSVTLSILDVTEEIISSTGLYGCQSRNTQIGHFST